MKSHYLLISIFLVLGSGTTVSLNAQKFEYIKVPELEKILKNPENKLFVVNLWATWCAPCVKELPDFEKVAKEFNSSRVKFIMVSLDFPSEIDKQLLPFLKKNQISLDVKVMTDTDYDSWIRKVDKDWQGNIPSTLVFNNARKTRYFHSGEISESELKVLIDKYL